MKIMLPVADIQESIYSIVVLYFWKKLLHLSPVVKDVGKNLFNFNDFFEPGTEKDVWVH